MPNYDLGTAEGKIVLDTSGVDNGIQQANQSMGRLGNGVNAERVGRDLTTGVSLPLIALGGFAIKTAIDFETAFAGVSKTIDGTPAEIDAVRDSIIDMSLRIPATTTELAGIAEAAGQLGIKVNDIEEFTEVMAALGVATNLSSVDAADGIARITNIMGTSVEDFGRFGAALVGLGNDSAATEHDILEMSNRIAGIANLSDSSEAEMLSLAAALSSVGVNAEAGGTAVTKTIKDFDEWTMAVIDAGGNIEDMNTKTKTFYELIGGADAFDAFNEATGIQQFDLFIDALQRAEADGANLISTLADLEMQEIRQSDSVLRLVGAGDLLSESIALGNKEWEENTALTDEAGKRYETTASQLQIVQNKASNAARILGEAMLPILIDLLNAVTPLLEGMQLMAESFGALPEPMRQAILGALALLAALGPVIFIGARIVRTITALSGVVKLVAGSFKFLGLVMAANPFVLLVLAIIALVAGFIILYKRSEKFREFINGLGEDIQRIWGKVVDFFKSLPEVFSGIWDSVKGAFSSAADAVVGAWNGVVDFFTGIGSAISSAFSTAVDAVSDFLSEAVDGVVDFFSGLPGLIANATTDAAGAFIDWLAGLPEEIAYWLGFAVGRFIKWHIDLVQAVIGAGTAVLNAVIGFMTRLPQIMLQFLVDAITMVQGWGTTLVTTAVETGTSFVTAIISALTEFIAWLPGFLLGIVTDIIQWGIQLVTTVIQIGIDFVQGLIGAIIALPGQVISIITQVVSGILGFAGRFLSAAITLGQNFVSGLIGAITGLPGLVYSMIRNAIDGVGNLASAAYNRMKSIGSSMWNGFKAGLGINSPSFIEEAAFAMRNNLGDVINSLGSQVRTMQSLSRGIPAIATGDQYGVRTALALSSAAAAQSPTDPAALGAGSGLTVNGPLIGEASVRDDTDIELIARRLDSLVAERNAAAGRRQVLPGGTR